MNISEGSQEDNLGNVTIEKIRSICATSACCPPRRLTPYSVRGFNYQMRVRGDFPSPGPVAKNYVRRESTRSRWSRPWD